MKPLLAAALLLCALSAFAQSGEHLNGMAAFSQLRKEYYIGALYLGWPGRDAAAIAGMPGKKRMELRITADRWPPLRFAQQWNQLILINNDSGLLNANVMDVLAFTGIPKADLVEGDHLVIEFEPEAGTSVSLNGTTVLRTNSPALFTMLLNTWIGARPPSSEFKRDMLSLPRDQPTTELAARYETLAPNDARKKLAAGWTAKTEAAEPAAAPDKTRHPEVAASKPETEIKPKPAIAPASAPPKPGPAESASPAATANAAPAPKEQKEQKDDTEKLQLALYNQYLTQIRRRVNQSTEYPRRAIKEGIEGLVVLRVQLDRLGNLLNIEQAQSAHEVLDRAAENAVKNARPFPAVNEQLEGNQFQFLVPIVFKLTGK